MKRIITSVFLLGCDHEPQAPACEQWIACYSECSTRAVYDLDEDTILACDVQCRTDINLEPDAPSPDPGWLRGSTWEIVVSQERGAVQDLLDARAAEQDGDVEWALFLANRSQSNLAWSLKARGECYLYGW